MKSTLSAAFAAVVLLATPALAQEKKAAAKEAKPNIVGTWKSTCESVPNGQGGTMNFTRTFKNTAKTWSIDFTVYGDAACTQKFFTADISGPYTLGKASEKVAGATEGEFLITKRTVTPHNDAAVQMITQACGVKDLKAGKAKDLTKEGCAGLGMHPTATCKGEHDLVKLDGKNLFFGERPADGNLCTPEKRPAALGKTPVTKS
jgi:hypothetical protein